jgi:1-acyl-sn-glycerol-3-phosphate acyltransferase
MIVKLKTKANMEGTISLSACQKPGVLLISAVDGILISMISKGISLNIMPEGTFNTTGRPLKDFYDGAFRVAIETQTTLKPYLLLDPYDRMHYRNLFTLTPGKSRAIFLEDVSVDGLIIGDLPVLKQKVYDLMEKKLVEYKASWISPQTP